MKHTHFSHYISVGRKSFKKNHGLFGVVTLLVVFVGLFFILRGATPNSSELSYIEHSSLEGRIGSVVPASCNSTPPGDHFRGDCSPTACKISPASPKAGDTVTIYLAPFDIINYINSGNYVTQSWFGTSPSYSSNTNYGHSIKSTFRKLFHLQGRITRLFSLLPTTQTMAIPLKRHALSLSVQPGLLLR